MTDHYVSDHKVKAVFNRFVMCFRTRHILQVMMLHVLLCDLGYL